MALHLSLNRFNNGEISPDLYGRWDLQDYDSSLEKMSGFIPTVTGKAEMMTGFKYIGLQHDQTARARMIPFEFTTADTFKLELGDLYFQVWSTGATPAVVATPVVTIFPESALDEIQIKPLNDQLYLTHKDYPTQVITRVTDSNWTIGNIPQDYPALLDGNSDTADTLAYTGTLTAGSSGTLAAVGHTPFTSDHIGGFWELSHWREASSVTPVDISITSGTATTSSLKVDGTYSVETSGFWWGTIDVEESETGSFSGEEIVVYSRSGKSDTNINVQLETASDVYIRVKFTSSGNPYGSGAGDPWDSTLVPTPVVPTQAPTLVKLSRERSLTSGIVKVTGFTSSTSVSVDVVEDLESSSATWRWAEGAWSDYQGYPAAMVIFEQRLIFGGTVRKPTGKWYSETDNIGTFSPLGTEASDPIRTSIAQDQNRILWMEAGKRIMIGTGINEYAVTSSNLEAAITPTNITLKKQQSKGSAPLPAIAIGGTILHVTRDRIGIQSLNFSVADEGYVDNDITRLAKHIFGSGIKQWAFQQNPRPTVWMLTEDGFIVGLVINQREEVTAFFRRKLEGTDIFESVSTIRGEGKHDQLWVTVNRNGVRTIERLADPTEVQDDMAYMDGHVQYDALGSKTVTGLPAYMEGREVIVWNDGAREIEKTVSGGSIELTNQSDRKLFVGFQYEKECVLLPIEAPAGDGASRGKQKSVTEIGIGTVDTITGYVGYKYRDGDWIEGETTPQLLYPADENSFTGTEFIKNDRTWREVTVAGNYRNVRPYFRGFSSCPMNVTFLIVKAKPKGD